MQAWPQGISSIPAWQINRTLFADYTCYLVLEAGDKYLLEVPAPENGHMPADMRPHQTIFFIIGRNGVRRRPP